jgi:hypothetical protein
MCVWPVSCSLTLSVLNCHSLSCFSVVSCCFVFASVFFQIESGSRTQFLNVSGVPSQRSELRAASVGTMDHDYVRAASKKISILVSKLVCFTVLRLHSKTPRNS